MWLLSIAMIACGMDEPTFRCDDSGGDGCLAGQVCPQVDPGSGGCKDLPSLFGHPAIPLDRERPVGCVATLPFENPYYPGSPQECLCQSVYAPGIPPAPGGSARAGWRCPL